MAGLTGSYVNESTAVNLTSLGAEDAISYNTAGSAIIRKTGGGSLITVNPWDYTTPPGSATTEDGTGGGFQNRQVTTTDFTASNITNKASCNYVQGDDRGYKVVFPAGTGERTAKLYLGHYIEGGSANLICIGTLSDGSVGPFDLTPTENLGADIDLTATFTYSAGSDGQTLTVDYYTVNSTANYIGFRGAHVSAAAGGGGSSIVAIIDRHFRSRRA